MATPAMRSADMDGHGCGVFPGQVDQLRVVLSLGCGLADARTVSAQSVSSAIKALCEPNGGLFVQHYTREVTDDGQ
jgi:hypothetical protein